jgi:hypothetical protein
MAKAGAGTRQRAGHALDRNQLPAINDKLPLSGSRLAKPLGCSVAAYSFEMTKNAQFLVYIQKLRPFFRRLPFNTSNRKP